MKKALKIGGGTLGALIIFAGAFVGFHYSKGAEALEKSYDAPMVEVDLPTDEASIAEGKRLLIARGCTECHGDDMGGKAMDMGPMGVLWGPNLTTDTLSNAETVRAIRHGIKQDGKPAILMPSEDYWVLSDQDVGMIMAAIDAMPKVERENKPHQIGPLAYVLLGAEKMHVAAEKIDHAKKRGEAPAVGPTKAYGEYIANTCIGCHGPELKGGIEQGPPGTPPSSDLTTALKGWSRDDLKNALTQGKRPNGGADLNPFMPAAAFRSMTEVEFDALHAYLSSMPGNQ